MRAMILIWAILVSSCTTISTITPLPLPNQPKYPELTRQEVEASSCLPEQIRAKLILRDKLKSDHIAELEGIITATH